MPTLDTYVGDLAAVVDAAGLERFALFGISGGGPTAIEYAVRNPERVSAARPLRDLDARPLQARRRRGRAVAAADRPDTRGLGRRGPRIPAGVQLDLHPERRRGAEALVRRPAAGLEQRRDGCTAVAVAQPKPTISDTARRVTQPALVLHARQDRAVPVRGGAAPGVAPPGRPLRDARERQPHPPGRGARLGGVPLGGACVPRR